MTRIVSAYAHKQLIVHCSLSIFFSVQSDKTFQHRVQCERLFSCDAFSDALNLQKAHTGPSDELLAQPIPGRDKRFFLYCIAFYYCALNYVVLG